MTTRFPLGIFLVVVITSAFRLWNVLHSGTPNPTLEEFFLASLNEARMVAPLWAAIAVTSLIANAAVRRVLWIPIALVSAFAFLNTVVLYLLDKPATIGELLRFASEFDAVSSFINWKLAVALVCVGIASTVQVQRHQRRIKASVAAALALTAVSWMAPPLPPKFLAYDWATSLDGLLPARSGRGYTMADLARFPKFTPKEINPGYRSKKRILLVVVESLSKIDSIKTGGSYDNLKLVDELAERGTLFTNALSTYVTSEGSLIGLFQGIAPIPYPGSTGYILSDFGNYPSLIREFSTLGFDVELLQAASLDFLGRRQYLKQIGFPAASGKYEIKRFDGAPRYAFNAPADRVLFEEVLERTRNDIQDNRRSFRAVFTASSHLPWNSPDGAGTNAAAVWNYVGTQLHYLVDSLEAMKFFEDDGLLIVTGDHRRMTRIGYKERELFGDSAPFRVVLFMVGSGVPKGRIDSRVFSHADLFTGINPSVWDDKPISNPAISVPWSPRVIRNSAAQGAHVVITKSDSPLQPYTMAIDGAAVEWQPDVPPDSARIEQQVHAQRVFGFRRSSPGPACSVRFHPKTVYGKGGVSGANLDLFDSRLDTLNDDDIVPRVMRSETIPTLEVPDDAAGPANGRAPVEYEIQTIMQVTKPGRYSFRFTGPAGARKCFGLEGQIVLGDTTVETEPIELNTGNYELRLHGDLSPGGIEWKLPGASSFTKIDAEALMNIQRD